MLALLCSFKKSLNSFSKTVGTTSPPHPALVKKDKSGLTSLANDLHIDVKTLYNKRVSATFTRDECLFIGARFGITVSELNKLLKENGRQELGFAGRDGLVRKALIDDQGLYELIDELEKNGFDGLLKNEYNE